MQWSAIAGTIRLRYSYELNITIRRRSASARVEYGKNLLKIFIKKNFVCIIKRITFVIQKQFKMKTILPAELKTQSEVETFLSDLYSNNEFFHLDDDANDIITYETKEPLFNKDEANAVNKLIEQAFAVCDVWELPIVYKILDDTTNQ